MSPSVEPSPAPVRLVDVSEAVLEQLLGRGMVHARGDVFRLRADEPGLPVLPYAG